MRGVDALPQDQGVGEVRGEAVGDLLLPIILGGRRRGGGAPHVAVDDPEVEVRLRGVAGVADAPDLLPLGDRSPRVDTSGDRALPQVTVGAVLTVGVPDDHTVAAALVLREGRAPAGEQVVVVDSWPPPEPMNHV